MGELLAGMGGDRAGLDGGDGDAQGSDLQAQRVGDGVHRGLGGGQVAVEQGRHRGGD
jgi:hypothetical protein